MKDQDAYGHELWDHFRGIDANETIERGDGYIDSSSGPRAYFSPYKKWPQVEKRALTLSKGRVLDVGCGAGRIGIYLQNKKNLEVIGIDNSPLAIKVSESRGLRKTELVPFQEINFPPSFFDTVIMFGNNFGLFASKKKAKIMLKKLYRMTSSTAILLCESVNPYQTKSPDHLAYQKENRAKGRMSGQLRIRVRYRKYVGKWFDYLIVSPREMKEIVSGTGWKVSRIMKSRSGPLYIGVITKDQRLDND